MKMKYRIILHGFFMFFILMSSGCKKQRKNAHFNIEQTYPQGTTDDYLDPNTLVSVPIFENESENESESENGNSVPKVSALSLVHQDTKDDHSVLSKPISQTKRCPGMVSRVHQSSLNVINKGVYIRIGSDHPGTIIKKRLPKKITVGLFPKVGIQRVDVYLYAIPLDSRLVRNDNTLIGFAKGVDVMHGQAQFTRYWDGQRVNKRYVKTRKYNIYVEYHCYDRNKRIVGRYGRFWGGDHRTWFVKVQ